MMRPSICALLAMSFTFFQPAYAGTSTLKVSIDRPVSLVVDGKLFIPDESRTYRVENLGMGNHELSFRTAFGKELENVILDIPADSEVRCRFKKKQRFFECYETIANTTAPVAAPQPVAEAPVSAPKPDLAAQPVAKAPTPSSAKPDVVEVSTTTVETTSAGIPAMGGAINLSSPDGESVSVGVNVGGMGLGINMSGTGIETTTTETTTVTKNTMPTAPASPPPPAAPTPKPTAPSNVSLILRSTDGEWADVVVDGKVVAEFRNDDEIQVTVSAGSHTLEVREYMEDNAYTRAKIQTAGTDSIIIGLTEGQPIECYNHTGCTTAY